jgi:hypothetical protein
VSPANDHGPYRRAATILVALSLLGLLLLFARHVLHDPDAESDAAPLDRTRDAAEDAPFLAPRRSGTPSPVDTAGASGSAPGWDALPGGTKFRQRLALGARLLDLRTRLASGAVDAEAVVRLIRRRSLPGLLALDAWERGLFEAGRMGSEAAVADVLLAWMADPRRDGEALVLHAAETEDAKLRVWTLGEAFPAVDRDAGEALLGRLEAIAGDRSPHGYDVVATSDMGQELFPRAPLFTWGPPAAGVYAPDDDVCLIRTIYPRAFQRVLLKHELVHAWAIRQRGLWPSRFLEEGLAEYLSRWLPSDARLNVPPRRFANEFAALLTLVRRQRAYGFGHGGFSFPGLMALEAQEFYGLGQMGYLLAQAAVAYGGGEAVEAAVRQGTDEPLRTVVRSLTWDTLVAFLEEHAVGGRAGEAIVIEDLTPSQTALQDAAARINGRRQPRRAFQAIRIDVPDGIGDLALGDFLELPVTVLAQDPERLASVLRGLRADGTGEVLLVSEATGAMLDPFRWSPETLDALSDLVAEPDAVDSRAAFVEQLHAGLVRTRKGRVPAVLAWHGRVESASPPLPVMAGPVKTNDLLARIVSNHPAVSSLVVCIASRDGTREAMRAMLAEAGGTSPSQVPEALITENLRNALAAYVRWMPSPPTRVLVIDLADGTSDARLVAEVFADALGREAPVALWNPQQPVR